MFGRDFKISNIRRRIMNVERPENILLLKNGTATLTAGFVQNEQFHTSIFDIHEQDSTIKYRKTIFARIH